MGLDKFSRYLLVNLFFQNNNKNSAALHEYRLIKEHGEILFSVPGLTKMIRRFQLTGDLGIVPGEADGSEDRTLRPAF